MTAAVHDCDIEEAHSDEDHANLRDYRIVVEQVEEWRRYDGDEPMVDGVIALTEQGFRTLVARLEAIKVAGHIAEYTLDAEQEQSRFRQAGVLNFIAGVGPDRDEDIVKVWESVA